MTRDGPTSARGGGTSPSIGAPPPAAPRTGRRRGVVVHGGPWDREALHAALSTTHLPKRLRAAAKFVLAHPDLVAFDTVAALAGRSGVTASAYVRLAHALGLSGFSDMRQILRQHLLTRSEGVAPERDQGQDVVRSRVVAVADEVGRAMSRLASRVDQARLRRAADMLAGASTVYLVGTRLAFPAVAFINLVLGQVGVRNVLVPSPAHNEVDTVRVAERRDVAICVDFSPPADETHVLARALRDRGVPILTITDDALGPTAKASTVVFDVGDATAPDVQHLAAAMALGRGLADAVAQGRTRNRCGTSP